MDRTLKQPARALRAALSASAAIVALSASAFGADAKTDFALVTPQWVAAHCADPDVRILDVRPDVQAYLAGHVPNAVHVADSAFRAPAKGTPVQYLSPASTATLLSRCGVRPKDTVVVYSDGANVLGATMVAYVLEKMNHPSVRILDGGWSAYQKTEKVSQEYPEVARTRVPARNMRSTHVTLEDVRKLIGKPGVVFIDSRPEPAYLGQGETWQRNGHIPGAVNVAWTSVMNADNPHQFRPVDELRGLYAAKGITPESDIILYCGTSREASLQYHVMKHLLGFPKVRLYEGSWTEYCSQPELKVDTTAVAMR